MAIQQKKSPVTSLMPWKETPASILLHQRVTPYNKCKNEEMGMEGRATTEIQDLANAGLRRKVSECCNCYTLNSNVGIRKEVGKDSEEEEDSLLLRHLYTSSN